MQQVCSSANAYAHGGGIHQDGVLRHGETADGQDEGVGTDGHTPHYLLARASLQYPTLSRNSSSTKLSSASKG